MYLICSFFHERNFNFKNTITINKLTNYNLLQLTSCPGWHAKVPAEKFAALNVLYNTSSPVHAVLILYWPCGPNMACSVTIFGPQARVWNVTSTQLKGTNNQSHWSNTVFQLKGLFSLTSMIISHTSVGLIYADLEPQNYTKQQHGPSWKHE